MAQLELSFVIPAYNEEDFIENTLGSIDAVIQGKHLPYEIVVVDDGSRDKTFDNAMRYAKRNGHVRVLTYPKNVGKGYAVRTGFMEANGNVVVFADGDMEIDLKTVSNYLDALKNGDIVIASKKHSDSRVNVPISRRVLSETFNGLVRILTGVPLKDTQSGLKAMKKSAFLEIFPKLAVKRYAFDVELLAVAHLHGLRVVEMPVNITLNASFKLYNMWHMFVDLLGIAYRLRVVHWYQRQIPTKDGLQSLAAFVFRED